MSGAHPRRWNRGRVLGAGGQGGKNDGSEQLFRAGQLERQSPAGGTQPKVVISRPALLDGQRTALSPNEHPEVGARRGATRDQDELHCAAQCLATPYEEVVGPGSPETQDVPNFPVRES